jgi:hypothetical protein
LSRDPREEENLIRELPAVAESMREKLLEIVAAGRSTPGSTATNDVPVRVGGD